MVTHYQRRRTASVKRRGLRYPEFTFGKRLGNGPGIPLLDAPPGSAGRVATGGQRAGHPVPRRPSTPKIQVAGMNFYYGARRVLENIGLERAAEPGDGAHRAVGLRQVHVPAVAQPHERHRARRARRGLGAASTAPTSTPPTRGRRRSAPARRHGLPEVEPVSEVDLRQRRLRAAHQPPDAIQGRIARPRRSEPEGRGALGRGARSAPHVGACRCPAASSSGSASPARSRSSPRWC